MVIKQTILILIRYFQHNTDILQEIESSQTIMLPTYTIDLGGRNMVTPVWSVTHVLHCVALE